GTSSAFAAEYGNCLKEVEKSCGAIARIMATYSTSGTECKFVEMKGLPKKIVFYDQNTVNSVELGSCRHNAIDLLSRVQEAKVMNGRLLVRTSAGHVLVVARDNSINYLTNANGKVVENITDITIQQKTDSVLIEKGNQSYPLSADQIGKKMSLIQD
ncbi:MAG: hypothetical protein ACXWR0_16520, partial [Bdellovibrio sp.]